MDVKGLWATGIFCERAGGPAGKTEWVPCGTLHHQCPWHTRRALSPRREGAGPALSASRSTRTCWRPAWGKWQRLLSVLSTVTHPTDTLYSGHMCHIKKEKRKQNLSRPGGRAPGNPHPLDSVVKGSIIGHVHKAAFFSRRSEALCAPKTVFPAFQQLKKIISK